MTNQQRNSQFLNLLDKKTRDEIITSIAKHYGTGNDQILAELTENEDSHHLLEYMVEPMRTSTSMLMQQHQLRGF
jgi:septum formation topological specificity factor MinE